MKTSLLLFLSAIVVVLTGMASYNVLLKKEYEKIDWTNPYQFYTALPIRPAKYLVLRGQSERGILLEQWETPQALVSPEDTGHVQYRQLGDTLFIALTTPDRWYNKPITTPDVGSLPVGIVLRLPALTQVNARKSRLLIRGFKPDVLTLALDSTKLQIYNLDVTQQATIALRNESYVDLSRSTYNRMQLQVQDSSSINLNDIPITQLTPTISARAQVNLRGQAIKWLTR